MILKIFTQALLLCFCVQIFVRCSSSDDVVTLPEDGEASISQSDDEKPSTKSEFQVISIEHGDIKGFLDKSSNGNQFYSFLGVPYAKPPTGTRRFKEPEVIENWEGVRDGSIPPPPCSQMDMVSFISQPDAKYVGEEDCLYLNIYTPEPDFQYADLPVLVYFHGGHFMSGSAADYEPYELLNAPLVLVVVQYRLGVLGFLSTEDSVMPGNLGLKDQTLALRWINRYIEHFGGSPLKITLFGSDAGAASVHYQILSHRTIGLFKKAILQSGNALCPWARGGVHKEAAYHIGKHFKCFPEDEEEREERKEEDNEEDKEIEREDKNAEDITENKEKVQERKGKKEEKEQEKEEHVELKQESLDIENENAEGMDKKADDKSTSDDIADKKAQNADNPNNDEDTEGGTENESPAKEKSEELLKCLQDVGVEELVLSAQLFYMWSYFPVIFGPYLDSKFIPEPPESLLKHGRHKRLDLIIGINTDDGSHITNSMFMSEGRRMALKHHFPLVGPISLEFSDFDVAPLNMSIKAYDKYTGGLNIDASDAHNLTKLFTDRHFAVCSDLAADFHSINNERYKRNVYYYEFNHRGQRTTGDNFGLNIGKDWVGHGDELYYLFPLNKTRDHIRDEEDEKMKELFVRMWYYFAETGNPTPNGTFEFAWEPYTTQNRQHLRLSTSPTMEEDNRVDVREFWTTLPTMQNIHLNKEYFLNLLNQTETQESETEIVNKLSRDGQEKRKTDNNNNNDNNNTKKDEL